MRNGYEITYHQIPAALCDTFRLFLKRGFFDGEMVEWGETPLDMGCLFEVKTMPWAQREIERQWLLMRSKNENSLLEILEHGT